MVHFPYYVICNCAAGSRTDVRDRPGTVVKTTGPAKSINYDTTVQHWGGGATVSD